jgi:hypothetical protein
MVLAADVHELLLERAVECAVAGRVSGGDARFSSLKVVGCGHG